MSSTTNTTTPAGTSAGTAADAPGVWAAASQRRQRRLWRACTVLAGAALAMAVWAIAAPILGIDLVAGSGAAAQPVGPVSVAASSLLLGGAAWALLALLERMGERGVRIWQVTGWLVLALSLAGPLLMGGAWPVLATLLLMHVVVGVTLMLGLAHSRRLA